VGSPEHSLERGRKTSIINFKGGVGKTTLALHLATYLATDHKVLLVDVDHQSSLSIVILGSALWEKQVKAQKTVNRVFESFCNRKIPMPKGEIIVPNPIGAREVSYAQWYPNLDFVSAQFELDDTEIDLASTTYGNANLSDWQERRQCWRDWTS
jgi:chromosome partitioning protein